MGKSQSWNPKSNQRLAVDYSSAVEDQISLKNTGIKNNPSILQASDWITQTEKWFQRFSLQLLIPRNSLPKERPLLKPTLMAMGWKIFCRQCIMRSRGNLFANTWMGISPKTIPLFGNKKPNTKMLTHFFWCRWWWGSRSVCGKCWIWFTPRQSVASGPSVC